uniref:(California timema) hypothetical protein n=1 Tax=Timema californicum TaxID=61474 RepID=A0A7R9JCD6_TIMCA|nr:unnamed protein product [Timema californicum]
MTFAPSTNERRIQLPAAFLRVWLRSQDTAMIGYADMGEVWREELETPELEKVIEKLYQMVEPLYMYLHAFVRHKLVQYYGEEIVKPTGTIPAHLLAPPGLFYHVLGQHRTVQPDNTLRHDFPPSISENS